VLGAPLYPLDGVCWITLDCLRCDIFIIDMTFWEMLYINDVQQEDTMIVWIEKLLKFCVLYEYSIPKEKCYIG